MGEVCVGESGVDGLCAWLLVVNAVCPPVDGLWLWFGREKAISGN